jgi:hypothetical protein
MGTLVPADDLPVASKLVPPEDMPGSGPAAPVASNSTDAVVRGATQGLTFGWGDEAAGGLAALLPFLDRQATAPKAGNDADTLSARYQRARDFYRGLNATAQAQNPGSYFAGQVAGGALPTAMSGGATLAGLKGLGVAAGQGMAQGAGYSEDEGKRLLGDTALGGALGVAGFGAGKALGAAADRLGSFASRKAGEAVGEAAAKINKAEEGALRSEVSSLGGKAQNLNRQIEWVIRLLEEEKSGTLTPGNRAALESFRGTPEFAEVVNKAAERVLKQGPAAVGAVSAQEAKVAAMEAALPQTVAQKTAEATSGKEAWAQIKARALRYGLPAVGGIVGNELFGDSNPLAAIGIGSLAGAGMRPMMHSLIRMRSNPAVRSVVYGALEKAGEAGASPVGAAVNTALGTGGAAALTVPVLHITGSNENPADHFVRWMTDPSYSAKVKP